MAISSITYKSDPINPIDYSEIITVPDQAMSLNEILERSLLGYDRNYSDSDDSEDDSDIDGDFTVNPEDSPGFDLADIPVVLDEAVDVVRRKSRKPSKKEVVETQDKVIETQDEVDK